MMGLLLALSMGPDAVSFDDLPVERVTAIAQTVMVSMKSDLTGLRPLILLSTHPAPTPLAAMRYADGRCVMLINQQEKAWAQWGRFLTRKNSPLWSDLIATSVAHEMGHCLNPSKTSYKQSEFSRLSGLHAVQKELLAQEQQQELFADTVAIIYAHEHFGATASQLAQTFIRSRAAFADSDPSHDTSGFLQALLPLDLKRKPNESFHQAAHRVLKQVGAAVD